MNYTLSFCLYWIPLAMCFLGYVLQTIKDYKADYVSHTSNYYNPKLTIGVLVGRLLITILPVFNLFTAVFKQLPMLIGNFLDFLDQTLNIPLIKANPKSDPTKDSK
jgi:hypothetical protein